MHLYYVHAFANQIFNLKISPYGYTVAMLANNSSFFIITDSISPIEIEESSNMEFTLNIIANAAIGQSGSYIIGEVTYTGDNLMPEGSIALS